MGLIFKSEHGLGQMKQFVLRNKGFELLTFTELMQNGQLSGDNIPLLCPKINPGYVIDTLKKAQDERKFDSIFIVDRSQEVIMIKGFIVIELGECAMHEQVWSVRLICALPGLGISLLGSFLYCLKNTFIVLNAPAEYQFAVLELSGNYENMAGFMLYTKLGFDKDLSLFRSDCTCFCQMGTLPMKADLSRLSPEVIMGIIEGNTDRAAIDDNTGLYSLYKKYPPNSDQKKALQTICNQLATAIVNFHKTGQERPEELGQQFDQCKLQYRELFGDEEVDDVIDWMEL
jgi:hypothetical protein